MKKDIKRREFWGGERKCLWVFLSTERDRLDLNLGMFSRRIQLFKQVQYDEVVMG